MRHGVLRGPAAIVLAAVALGGAFGVHAAAGADAETFAVPAELWDRPRTGAAVIGTAAVRQAIGALLARPDARMTIRHPPGAEALLQAEELKAWLVAHALESGRIALRGDLAPRAPLQMEIGR